MSSSGNESPNSNTAATDEATALVVVPKPTTDTNEMPANVAPDVPKARPPSTIADPNPVTNARALSVA